MDDNDKFEDAFCDAFEQTEEEQTEEEQTEEEQTEEEQTEEEFDSSGFSTDKEKNRKQRFRDVQKCIDRAKEQYADALVKDVVDSILNSVVRNNDTGYTSSEFKCDLKRNLRMKCRERGLKPIIVNDHVSTVIIRLACSENSDFIEYAPMSKAECDDYLYRSNPNKYKWISEKLYGDAL